ncbi:MAG: DUF2461 domain-containing protein [Actinomycetota bacterium]
MAFTGFPAEAFAFYEQLAAHNTKAWWEKNRSTYDGCVKAPMTALLDALEPEFGEAKVHRPYRDTRFSKDKAPLKDHQGAVVMIEDAAGYYVQVSASGLMVGGGLYAPAPVQLARVRAAIDSPAVVILEKQLEALRKARPAWTIDMSPLKTRPKGVPADHPHLELLRMTRLVFTRSYDEPATVESKKLLDAVRRDWRAITPALEWLADHAGPMEDPGREP